MRLLVIAILGCGQASSPPSPDLQWACTTDADCMSSRAAGAVSRAWYAHAKVLECKDGCAGDNSAAPRCIDKACVAFRDVRGKVTRDEGCTHQVAPLE